MGFFSKLFAGAPSPAATDDVAKKRILIVEPSITVQKVLELTLRSSSIVPVKDAKEAQAALRTGPFDLVITAVVLPDSSGYDLCTAVKATTKTPVILLHGAFEPLDENRAEQSGVDAIQTKPFDSQAFLDRVNSLLT
jgi:DNA-binding response OmpR family regulator